MDHITPVRNTWQAPRRKFLTQFGLIVVHIGYIVSAMTEYGDRFNAAVAAELRAARARVGITYAELISATGIAQSTLQRYLKGERDIPLPAFKDLCRALGVAPRCIFDLAEKALDDE